MSNVRPQMQVPLTASVFYTRVAMVPAERLLPASLGGAEVMVVGHFYLKVEESFYASGWASDFCTEHGFEFKEFLSLPAEVTEESIREYEPEHARAYAIAAQDGHATILSVVMAPSLRP
jgi:hypothetical protein